MGKPGEEPCRRPALAAEETLIEGEVLRMRNRVVSISSLLLVMASVLFFGLGAWWLQIVSSIPPILTRSRS
jgi:hypothetical protein